MADTSLQERLREHAKAFDGLLSLIPAKMYYGEDTSDQWRKKKQTKDQARAAKRGKLDPDSELNKSAKDVLDERARNKRKLQELEDDDESQSGSQDDDDDIEIPGIVKEKPLEGMKKRPKLDEDVEEAPKPQKPQQDAEQKPVDDAASKRMKVKEEKKLAKKQKKEEAKKKEVAKKAKEEATKGGKSEVPKSKKTEAKAPKDDEEDAEEAEEAEDQAQEAAQPDEADISDDMAPIDVSGLANDEDESSAESAPDSPIFDTAKTGSAEPASTTTSISSAVPPSEKPKIKVPADTTALRQRLEAKLAALRAARKADDPEGKPIRTRQDLIEARRAKQAQRKAHKQELRRKAKEEEERKREEALASARDSPGLSPLLKDDNTDPGETHFAFGRLAFSDGTQLSHDLSYEKTPDKAAKKKGPSDPKSALAQLEAKKKRLEAMDEDKRKEVLEKEAWLAARRRAEGIKVHDNESLLKKALKRKEKAKKKSEREWKERAEGVKHAMQERQRKREENLRKRREEKLAHRAGKKKNKGVQTKKKNRPGFEGGFGGGRK
ncbi:hypothetical protein VTJ49DRAFT_5258 [Mycothermus thermophilus]|uniref:SURF6-domain-containing protein n=1 Tax=Humicola insolens TaxID=85995 RepID=A0ABR3V3J7_HUMIN